MSRDPPPEQHVLDLRARPDVVQHQGTLLGGRAPIYDDSDVRNTSTQIPGNDVSRGVVIRSLGDWQDFTLTPKESRKVGNAAVIDISVGLPQSPFLWIRGETTRHVLVDFLLQVDADLPVDPNQFIRAHPAVSGDISARVRNAHITAVVPD